MTGIAKYPSKERGKYLGKPMNYVWSYDPTKWRIETIRNTETGWDEIYYLEVKHD